MRRIPKMLLLFISFLAPEALVAQSAATVKAKFRTVAMSGDVAPGLPDGLKFGKVSWPNTFGDVSIGPTGKVAFQTGLRGKGLVDNYSTKEFGNGNVLYIESEDGLKPLLRNGDSISVEHPIRRIEYIQHRRGSNGEIIVVARTNDEPRGSDPTYAVLTGPNQQGEVQPVLQSGDPAVGTAGEFNDFGGVLDNAWDSRNGRVTFTSILANKTSGLWTGKPDSLKTIGISGENSLSEAKDVVVRTCGKARQNAKGNVVFSAFCGVKTGETSYKDTFKGLWFMKDGTPNRIAGDAIEGMPENAKNVTFLERALNDVDQIAMTAGFNIANSKSTRGEVLILHENGKSRVLLKSGDTVPGTETEITGFKKIKFNSTGQLAVSYHWKVAGDRALKTGIILLDPATRAEPKVIMAEQTAAPGTGEGTLFGKTHRFEFATPTTVVFASTLSGGDTPVNSRGIFVSRNGKPPEPLLLPAMEIEVKPGDKRVAKNFEFGATSGIADANGAAHIPIVVRFRKGAAVMVAAIEK